MRRSLRWRTKPPAGVRVDPQVWHAWGIYGLWGLEDGGGPACGDMVGSNPLSLIGAPQWTVGPEGPVIQFPGVAGNYLQSQGSIFDPAAGDFSAALWVYTTATAFQALLSMTGSSGSTWLETGTGNHLWCTVGTGTALRSTTPTGVVTLNAWHHVALTVQGTLVTGYLDGEPVLQGGTTIAPNGGGHLNVGVARDGVTNPLQGFVGGAGVLLGTRCWLPEEVAWLAAAPYGIRVGPAAPRAAAQAGGGNTAGSGAPALGAFTVAGTGSRAVPVWMGQGGPTLGPLGATGSGSTVGPGFVGSGAPQLGALTAVGQGSRAIPLFLVSGGPSLGPLTADGSGSGTGPLFVTSGSPTLGDWGVVAEATATGLTVAGDGSPALGSLTVAGLGMAVRSNRYVPSKIYGNITPLSTGGPAVVKVRIRPA